MQSYEKKTKIPNLRNIFFLKSWIMLLLPCFPDNPFFCKTLKTHNFNHQFCFITNIIIIFAIKIGKR